MEDVTNSAGESVPIGATEGGVEIAPESGVLREGHHYPRHHSGFSFNELVKVVDEFNKADCECCSPSDLDTAFDEAGFVYDEDGHFDGEPEADAVREKLHAFAVVLAYATAPAPDEQHALKNKLLEDIIDAAGDMAVDPTNERILRLYNSVREARDQLHEAPLRDARAEANETIARWTGAEPPQPYTEDQMQTYEEDK